MDDSDLGFEEVFWRDTQPFLFKHGYQLRPRFRPGWIPSWTGMGERFGYFEDAQFNKHYKTIDAQRIRDGRIVFIKRVEKGSPEISIIKYLSEPRLRKDVRNHAVPLLDLLDGDGQYDFIVMPLLRRFNNPPFMYVEEAIDFIRQTLEGLVFLHEVGVAHRDCSDLNIMLDADRLYPEGFHPSVQIRNLHGPGLAEHLERVDVSPPVTYYFTDFGISSHFKIQSRFLLVTGGSCQDKTVPELSDFIPYNPFLTDIYILGNLYKNHFVNLYSNLSFLLPLVTQMTKISPATRPSAVSALEMLEDILKQQNRLSLGWLLLEPNLTRSERARRGVHSILRLCNPLLKELKELIRSPLIIFVFTVSATSIVIGPHNIINRINSVFRQTTS